MQFSSYAVYHFQPRLQLQVPFGHVQQNSFGPYTITGRKILQQQDMSEEEGGHVVHRVTDLVVIQVQHNNLTSEKWSKNNTIIQWGSNTLQEHDQHISFLNHFEVGIAAETSPLSSTA
jgi:hypothetical protein